MDAVNLKLNESKTEFIYLGSRQQLSKCSENTIRVINEQQIGAQLSDTLTHNSILGNTSIPNVKQQS